MTAKCALCMALLEGKTLNVKNVFTTIGITNCAREISRMVEKDFGVIVERIHMKGKSRYQQPVTWIDYKLKRTVENVPGIEKMKKYCKSQLGDLLQVKTQKQKNEYQQQNLFLSI